MKKTIASLFILVIALFLVPLSSEATQINFYDIDTLSQQERTAIIKGKPELNSEYKQYNFIYQNSKNSSNMVDSSDSGSLVGQEHSGTVLKATNQSRLPKAGEIGHTDLWLYGSGFIAISIIVLYKRKKYSKLLLLIFIPTAIGTTSIAVLAKEGTLIPAETISISAGEVKSIEPAVINGYTYVGYYPVAEITPPNVMSTILVRYVDENSNELQTAQTITGTIGEAYDASTEKYKLSIAGYTLNEAKLPANATGTFAEKQQTVVYEYKKEVEKKGTVTVQYLNKNGDEIIAADVLTGEIGQAFYVEKKEITNFLFEHAEGELDGVFSTEEMLIQLYYTDEVEINIHYVDKHTKEPLILNALSYYAEYLRPDVSDIDDYYYTNTYNQKTYSLGSVAMSDQLIVKVGTEYTLPKEIEFLITKPDGQTVRNFEFPKAVILPNGGWIIAVSSYSNIVFNQERPGDVPGNYTGVADKLEIDVTYELQYIATAIPEP